MARLATPLGADGSPSTLTTPILPPWSRCCGPRAFARCRRFGGWSPERIGTGSIGGMERARSPLRTLRMPPRTDPRRQASGVRLTSGPDFKLSHYRILPQPRRSRRFVTYDFVASRDQEDQAGDRGGFGGA